MGAAGPGKTQTIRAVVTILRSVIESKKLKCTVAICSYTGVASTLMGWEVKPYVHYLKSIILTNGEIY